MNEHEIKPVNFKKIFTIIFILIIIIGTGLCVLSLNKKNSKEEVKTITKTNEKLTEDQIIGNLSINNISLVTKNGKSVFSAKATNLTANVLNIKSINIKVMDNNQEIVNLIGYFGGVIGPEETHVLTAETNILLQKATMIEFSLNE